jgi:hypothetical protein
MWKGSGDRKASAREEVNEEGTKGAEEKEKKGCSGGNETEKSTIEDI